MKREYVIVSNRHQSMFSGCMLFWGHHTEDDYDIKMPYDHARYHELDPYNEKRWLDKSREPMYFHDNDGYDFTKGRFS